MASLNVLFFVALATISVINVKAKHEDPSETAPERPQGPPWEDENLGSVTFDTNLVKNALFGSDPIKEDVSFSFVFAKILTALRKEGLNVANAAGFLQKMCQLATKTKFWPYLELFKSTVAKYEDFTKEKGWGLEEYIEVDLEVMLWIYSNEEDHFIPRKIAPLLEKLIVTESDRAEDLASEVVTNFLEDPDVQKEVARVFIGAEPINSTANKYVTDALKISEE